MNRKIGKFVISSVLKEITNQAILIQINADLLQMVKISLILSVIELLVKNMKNITTFDLSLLEQYKKIFVLVSGGFDSTYLADIISEKYPNKTYFVNCWNPYEQSKTLRHFKNLPNYLEIKPAEGYNYKQILIDSFEKLNESAELRKNKKYHKKVFGCCYFIKHKAFLKNKLFKEENTCVISGIKRGDGTQRRIWLTQLGKGAEPANQSNGLPTFTHKHKGCQNYIYPFRDYTKRELPEKIIAKLKRKYPNISHSGCSVCPVLVLFNIKKEGKRFHDSVKFAKKYIIPSKILKKYNPSLNSTLDDFKS